MNSPDIHRTEQGAYHLRDDGKDWLTFEPPALEGANPHVDVRPEGKWQHVRIRWKLVNPVTVEDLSILFELPFVPDFWWAPHLAPEAEDVIAQHVFRSPALIAAQGGRTVVMVPDLALCAANSGPPWYLDVNAPEREWRIGISPTDVTDHVRYTRLREVPLAPGSVELGFYVTTYEDENTPVNPWEKVSRFLWEKYAQPLFAEGAPIDTPMDRYVEWTNRWAFDTWEDPVWQEFAIEGQRVGAPAFIVNVTQSPNYDGNVNLREFLSIWNQAWFSSLRSASGVMRYAQRTDNADLERRAQLTKEFALAAPQKDGLFPTVYGTEMEKVEVEGGRTVNRSKGWDTGHWLNSDRMPWERGITPEWYNVLDMSWTCLLMLRWHEDLEQDPRLLDYARNFGNRLLTLQNERGFFPSWLHPETEEPSTVLFDSPQTSMCVTFLLELAEIANDPQYREAALRGMDAVLVEIVPAGRWEDFETYWSCNPYGKENHLGRMFQRNGMYKQNNFSMFWTAEALLAAFRATGDDRYLNWGLRTMDELSMTQQVWQPPFIYVPALGGFGVMNFDGEWNDARQSLFAELYMDYYRETGDTMYFERGVAALKASFIMMYCPENTAVKPMWEKVWTFFGEKDYGFMMENYGHGGYTSPEGEGMGSFTIYSWGNGAASEARCRIFDHYGDVYIDRERREGFGIDSVNVERTFTGYRLRDLAGSPREIRVVYEDGSSETVLLDGEMVLR